MGRETPSNSRLRWHLIHALEAFDQVALAELFVHCIDGRMAVQAGAGLMDDRLAFGSGTMAGFDPAVILLLHDVAVSTRRTIIGQV